MVWGAILLLMPLILISWNLLFLFGTDWIVPAELGALMAITMSITAAMCALMLWAPFASARPGFAPTLATA
jgi:hypothetical protein